MGVINLRAEQREIKDYLIALGASESDVNFFLGRLAQNQDGHLQYLRNAREARAKASNGRRVN